MDSKRFIAVITGLIFVFSPLVAISGDAASLKAIMQGLRNDLVKITDGLLVDDFDMIAEGALGIAEHPRIPADQVKLVAAELGTEMPAFKQLDTLVHDLSMRVKAAAEDADREEAHRNYREMTDGCLACHAAFKERVARTLAAADET